MPPLAPPWYEVPSFPLVLWFWPLGLLAIPAPPPLASTLLKDDFPPSVPSVGCALPRREYWDLPPFPPAPTVTEYVCPAVSVSIVIFFSPDPPFSPCNSMVPWASCPSPPYVYE